METNRVPASDSGTNTTGCCPRFDPSGWDGQRLHFEDKPFLRATTRSALHVPLNMGRVFDRVQAHLAEAGAQGPDDMIVLSRDLSPWEAEHLFSVSAPVAGEETVRLSGDFLTRVFEGPYRNVPAWEAEMRAAVAAAGSTPGDVWLYYTTCPRWAKAYGENYVVAVARL